MTRTLLVCSAVALLCYYPAHADSITLNGGYIATGTILQTNHNENSILLLRDYGTADYYMPIVKSVKIEDQNSVALPSNTNRTSNFKHILSELSRKPWAQNLRQIPATVIDKGILRYVPYVSFQCGDDYEVNIYGDLDHPAAIEIGIYRKLLTDDTAKNNCLTFVQELLPDSADQAILRKLKQERDSQKHNGLTFEITPPTSEDAYLGWWVSVYAEKELNRARASESELKQISVAKTQIQTNATQEISGWSAKDLTVVKPTQTYQPRIYSTPSASPPPARTYTPPMPAGGSVYVRGYTRKDGTYVAPYTRSAPHRR